jgi:HK97 gp10 family phage protein
MKLVSRIQEVVLNLTPAVDRAVQSTAREIRDTAKTLSPVKTGKLRKSIESRKTGEAQAQVGTDVDYGIYQEYGTRHMSAQPFLTPAFQAHKDTLKHKIKEEIEKL